MNKRRKKVDYKKPCFEDCQVELKKKLELEVEKKTNELQKKIDAQETKIFELNKIITEMHKEQHLANEGTTSQQIGAYKLSTRAKACENIYSNSALDGILTFNE